MVSFTVSFHHFIIENNWNSVTSCSFNISNHEIYNINGTVLFLKSTCLPVSCLKPNLLYTCLSCKIFPSLEFQVKKLMPFLAGLCYPHFSRSSADSPSQVAVVSMLLFPSPHRCYLFLHLISVHLSGSTPSRMSSPSLCSLSLPSEEFLSSPVITFLFEDYLE